MNLTSVEWDILIILDACRYDYFEKNYDKFLDGNLKKIKSVAQCTTEWLVKTFTEDSYDDIVYISANPFVNTIKEVKHNNSTFNAKKFFKIVPVWDFGWDDDIKTVRPEEMAIAYKKVKSENPDNKFLLHYMQPHYPYIELSEKDPEMRLIREKDKQVMGTDKSFKPLVHLGYFLNKFGKVGWKIRKFGRKLFNIPDTSQYEYIINKYGIDELHEQYEKNLLIVLESIKELLPELNGKVIISSDHAEMLGEHGKFGHSSFFKRYPVLVDVPYLEVKK